MLTLRPCAKPFPLSGIRGSNGWNEDILSTFKVTELQIKDVTTLQRRHFDFDDFPGGFGKMFFSYWVRSFQLAILIGH